MNIKKIMSIMAMITMISVIFAPAAVTADAGSDGTSADMIKVGLRYGTTAEKTYDISSEKGFYIGTLTDGQFSADLPVSAYTSLTVTSEKGMTEVRSEDGNVVLTDLGNSVIMPYDHDGDGLVSEGGKKYRGGFMFTENNDGTLNLINVLSLEHYVCGVLNSEMHHMHPIEALKAQAVAARSYAKLNRDRHSAYGFDVCTGTHCQVYKGYANEYEESNRAVRETEGLCIYYGGKTVPAFYFKNSGGHTQNVEDVWGSHDGYLRGVKEIYSPEYKWTAEFTFGEREKKLRSGGHDIGSLRDVEIVSHNSAGAVDTLRFTGSKGKYEISGEKVRTFFGYGAVKSTMFSMEKVSGNGNVTPAPAADGKVYIKDAFSGRLSEMPERAAVAGASGFVSVADTDKLYMTNGHSTVKVVRGENKPAEDGDKGGNSRGSVIFRGSGYGQGIGLPQDSAIEMAKQGFTYDEILKYYYTGIEIK